MILNTTNYKTALKGISIIEVSGESCANCYTLMPLLSAYVKQREDCSLHHLEVTQENQSLVEQFAITSVPTILVCYQEEIMARCHGYQPEEILSIWLDAKIAEIKEKYEL